MTKIGPDHYRYVEELEEVGVMLKAHVYVVVGETPKCWYVLPKGYVKWAHSGVPGLESMAKKARRRVLKQQDEGRRFCYANKRLAMHSLIMRKKFQLRRLKTSTSLANLALKAALTLAENYGADQDAMPTAFNCGHDEHTESFDFSDC